MKAHRCSTLVLLHPLKSNGADTPLLAHTCTTTATAFSQVTTGTNHTVDMTISIILAVSSPVSMNRQMMRDVLPPNYRTSRTMKRANPSSLCTCILIPMDMVITDTAISRLYLNVRIRMPGVTVRPRKKMQKWQSEGSGRSSASLYDTLTSNGCLTRCETFFFSFFTGPATRYHAPLTRYRIHTCARLGLRL